MAAADARAVCPCATALSSLLLFVQLACTTAKIAEGRRPLSPDAWWLGLDAAKTESQAEDLVSLRAPGLHRVRVEGTTFRMGSTLAEIEQSLELCQTQPFRQHCEKDPADLTMPSDPLAVELMAMLRAELPAHLVTITTFEIDRTEVTIEEYERCVAAGACEPAAVPQDRLTRAPRLPITHVRWEAAQQFCAWAAGRLPTEAEWELAARGPEGREFPWGNVYNARLANHGSWAEDRTDATDGFLGPAPVGSFPDGATPQGILDMAGNVAEWVADEMALDASGRPVGYSPNAQIDPRPKPTGGLHIVRGGSYEDAPMWLRSAARDTTSWVRSSRIGFRCAADIR